MKVKSRLMKLYHCMKLILEFNAGNKRIGNLVLMGTRQDVCMDVLNVLLYVIGFVNNLD